MYARTSHRRSPIMMAASSSSRRTEQPQEDSNHHSSAPMDMSRRGFLISSLASISFLSSPLLAANSPSDTSDTMPDAQDFWKRNSSTTNSTRSTYTTRPTKTGTAASKKYHGHETHHKDEDHKDLRKHPKVKVRPTDGRKHKEGNTSMLRRTPPRIKGLARNELFPKISELSV